MTAEPPEDLDPTHIPRDRFDRPQIICADGKTRTYTRTSKMAKTLSDSEGVQKWVQRIQARGLARNPSAFFNQLLSVAQQGEHKLSVFDDVLEAAREVGGGNDASRWGTSLHGLAEWFDAEDYKMPADADVPPDLMEALDAYVELTKSVEMLACEGFVVNDEIRCAGSFDRLCILPDSRLVIGDIKTAPDIHKERGKVAEAAMQLAIYSRSVLYHPDGTRTSFEEAFGAEVDTSVGLIIQVSRDRSGDRLIPVDLNLGWRNVLRAVEIRESRRQAPIRLDLDGPVDPVPF